MNRVERVNCAALVAILVTLLLLAGHQLGQQHTAPATATVAASETLTDSVTVASDNEPSGVGGMTVGELLSDAWTTYRAALGSEPAPSGEFTIAPEYQASYGSTPPAFPATYVALESKQRPGIFHVFNMVASQRA